jgi:hypothetical protein
VRLARIAENGEQQDGARHKQHQRDMEAGWHGS